MFSSNYALLMLSKHLAVAGDTEIKVFYRAVVILSDSENCMAHELLTSFSKMWQQCHPFVQYDQGPFTSKSYVCIFSLIPL